ncbi:MAG: Uma2 family endonuclease [Rhodothermales bacterium]
MSLTTQTRPAPAAARPLRRFTVGEYYAMAAAGILKREDRVELIDGYLFAMSPIGIRHAACVLRLNRLFSRAVDPQAFVNVQNPVRLSNRSEPEPDLALLVPKDAYEARHPRADDVLLLVEVSETTFAFDRDVKLPLYALEGIREVWIVALEEDVVYAYRGPTDEGFAEARTLRRGEQIGVEAMPDVPPFAVNDILGA